MADGVAVQNVAKRLVQAFIVLPDCTAVVGAPPRLRAGDIVRRNRERASPGRRAAAPGPSSAALA